MPLVVLVLFGITSLVVTLTLGGVFRRELRSLRRVVEEGRDDLDVRVLGARRRVQARSARYAVARQAHPWRASQRAAHERESLRRLDDLIAKVEAHPALVAIFLEQEQAVVDRRYRDEAPDRVAKAADVLQRRRKTERGTHAKQEHGQGEGQAISVKTVETHRARLCAKVATHSVADLTRLAVRAGLIEA